jgi:hypothetical protein
MAFGKKKDDPATSVAVPVEAEAEDDSLSLFPDSGEDDALAAEAPAATPAEGAAGEPAPAPAPEALPSTDSLLSAFQTTEGADDDRSVLLEMAGDVDLADLLEELNTLSAAIGVARR